MIPAKDAPTRPALRYYGGKWKLAPWILSYFPKHNHYCEPCGGAASVLLQKPRAHLETYNDVEGNVVNFFRMLRDRPEELVRKINLTPWARDEYLAHYETDSDPLEQARRFWVGCNMSIANMGKSKTGFRVCNNYKNVPTGGGASWFFLDVKYLEKAALRLRAVQIENRDFFEVALYNDNPKNLIYFDPPYVQETRSNSNQYAAEVNTDFHIQAAGLLRSAQGFVVVSGYACPLYTELYEVHGWPRFDKEAQTNSGGKRIESLWLSPRTLVALGKPMQMALQEQAVEKIAA